jgi:hypothetical protein
MTFLDYQSQLQVWTSLFIQYADDTLIVLEALVAQLFFLKGVLQSFSDSTRLQINFSKSMMVPVNLSNEKLNHLARTFGCQTGSFPFTYLGLPLGLKIPKVDDFLPLINKCERRLNYISPFLSQAGRLELTNLVLAAYQLILCAQLLCSKQ